MICSRCSRVTDDNAQRCECGYRFQVEVDELAGWYEDYRALIERAYLAAEMPWQQSGKSGNFEEWTRLPQFRENLFVGNALDWHPPTRFDYVRTNVEFVPLNMRRDFLHRLLQEFVSEDGMLLVAHYRGTRDDPIGVWIDEYLRTMGFNVVDYTRGFSREGLEKCRVAKIRREM